MNNKIIDDTIKTNSKMGSFLHDVERIHKNGKIDYMDAIIHYCEVNSIDVEVAAQYIKKNAMLKAKIQQEAEDLNFLEKTSRLPL